MGSQPAPSLAQDAYLREALRETFDWYKQADSKAQIVLGFTGVFLSIVVGSVLLKHEPSAAAAKVPQAILIGGVAAVLVLYLIGVGLCIAALWSRGILRALPPGIHFFGRIASCGNAAAYLEAAARELADPESYRLGYAQEVYILAVNTLRKHVLVNFAVLSSGSALLLTVLLGLTTFMAS